MKRNREGDSFQDHVNQIREEASSAARTRFEERMAAATVGATERPRLTVNPRGQQPPLFPQIPRALPFCSAPVAIVPPYWFQSPSSPVCTPPPPQGTTCGLPLPPGTRGFEGAGASIGELALLTTASGNQPLFSQTASLTLAAYSVPPWVTSLDLKASVHVKVVFGFSQVAPDITGTIGLSLSLTVDDVPAGRLGLRESDETQTFASLDVAGTFPQNSPGLPDALRELRLYVALPPPLAPWAMRTEIIVLTATLSASISSANDDALFAANATRSPFAGDFSLIDYGYIFVPKLEIRTCGLVDILNPFVSQAL